MHPALLDTLLATVPVVALAAVTWRVTWRVTWPKWQLAVRLLLHPCAYALRAVCIGHWSVLVAWVHQGVPGLGGHIRFSRRHGFTWYAVEDPERYVRLPEGVDRASRQGPGAAALTAGERVVDADAPPHASLVCARGHGRAGQPCAAPAEAGHAA